MTTVFGDKIGIEAATPGGSNGSWGTEYGAAFTKLDEYVYAAREDRNLIIQGGGKISWDGSQVTFSANFNIYNSITAYKNILTTAASSCALSASGKVAYIQLTRKPAADNTLTSMTVVDQGALPNGTTDADMGTVVLFFRTTDGTLYIPWAKKELLAGDHWQVGAAQTWYERIAASRKPGYRYGSSTTVIVPATATAPACVEIDGKIYANTSNATCAVGTSGRNGVDTGSVAASTLYYFYAIPAVSGRTFDVTMSVTAPTTGPTGFSQASYLGGFPTNGSSQISPFVASNGFVQLSWGISSQTIKNTTPQSFSLKCPSAATHAWVLIDWSAGGTDNICYVQPTDGGGSITLTQLYCRCTSSVEQDVFGFVSLLTSQTVWIATYSAAGGAATGRVALWGWHEDPMGYK